MEEEGSGIGATVKVEMGLSKGEVSRKACPIVFVDINLAA